MIRLLLVLPLLLLTSLPLRANGSIEGTVKLPHAITAPVVNKRYAIVAKGGILAPNPPFAIVYLEGHFPAGPLPTREMVQKDLDFVTPIIAVQTGTRVEFPNHDDTYHSIFSYSATKRFDLGRYTAEDRPVPSQRFDKAGLVTVRCDIHEHMRGLILVVDTPYFVNTASDGTFRLPSVPSGRYSLKAWINSMTTYEIPVTVTDGQNAHVQLP